MAGACVKREDGVTICAECVHQNGNRCGAIQNRCAQGVDVVTGADVWLEPDGSTCASAQPLCEDVNEGACPYYEAK